MIKLVCNKKFLPPDELSKNVQVNIFIILRTLLPFIRLNTAPFYAAVNYSIIDTLLRQLNNVQSLKRYLMPE